MRLIDADALHDALRAKQKWIVKRENMVNEGYTYDQVHFAIDDMPTVDAIHVLRCKDCKHYEETDAKIGTCLLTICGAYPEGYCAWAEVKEQ